MNPGAPSPETAVSWRLDKSRYRNPPIERSLPNSVLASPKSAGRRLAINEIFLTRPLLGGSCDDCSKQVRGLWGGDIGLRLGVGRPAGVSIPARPNQSCLASGVIVDK
jgi:hypothetical protein